MASYFHIIETTIEGQGLDALRISEVKIGSKGWTYLINRQARIDIGYLSQETSMLNVVDQVLIEHVGTIDP